jgi:hypothetical protein
VITRDDNMENINNRSKSDQRKLITADAMLPNMSIRKPNIIDYMEYLKNRGYDREKFCIDETYTDIVTRLSLAKGAVGTTIDVRCPPSYKMVMIGSSQLPLSTTEAVNRLKSMTKVDHEEVVQLPEEYSTCISSMTIRLANAENIEIDPDVRIKIIKEKVSQSVFIIDTIFYKDISATAYTKTSATTAKCCLSETKNEEEQYVFDKGIELNGSEHLKIEAIYPNTCIDASNTRLSLGLDLWEQE